MLVILFTLDLELLLMKGHGGFRGGSMSGLIAPGTTRLAVFSRHSLASLTSSVLIDRAAVFGDGSGPGHQDHGGSSSLTARDLGVIIPMMKASLGKLKRVESEHTLAVQEERAASREAADDGIDVLLLEDSLAKTPWERMQANDDALRFADSLRAALEERDAKSERTDAPAG